MILYKGKTWDVIFGDWCHYEWIDIDNIDTEYARQRNCYNLYNYYSNK